MEGAVANHYNPYNGGEGIRTLGTFWYTRVSGGLLKPLGHPMFNIIITQKMYLSSQLKILKKNNVITEDRRNNMKPSPCHIKDGFIV